MLETGLQKQLDPEQPELQAELSAWPRLKLCNLSWSPIFPRQGALSAAQTRPGGFPGLPLQAREEMQMEQEAAGEAETDRCFYTSKETGPCEVLGNTHRSIDPF